jgi:hypothetical protein
MISSIVGICTSALITAKSYVCSSLTVKLTVTNHRMHVAPQALLAPQLQLLPSSGSSRTALALLAGCWWGASWGWSLMTTHDAGAWRQKPLLLQVRPLVDFVQLCWCCLLPACVVLDWLHDSAGKSFHIRSRLAA